MVLQTRAGRSPRIAGEPPTAGFAITPISSITPQVWGEFDGTCGGRWSRSGGGFPLFRPPNWLPGRQGICLGWFAGFSRPKRSGDPGATFFIAALTFQEAAVRGHASLKEVLRL